MSNFTTVAPESTAPVGLKIGSQTMDDGFDAGVTVLVDASGARAKSLAINAAGEAAVQVGTDITTPTAMPTGGVGIRGWLSAIWTKLNGTIGVTGTFWQAIQPVSGTVTANAGTGTLAVSIATVPAHAVTNAGTFAVQSSAAASELHLGEVAGKTVTVGVEITRPSDTTAYAALDSVNTSTGTPTSITFAGMSRIASGTGYITKARLVTDQSACVAQMRLWLFNAAPNTLNNDNAAFLIKYADKLTCIGYIDFPVFATEAGSDCAQALAPDIRIAFTADASSQLLGVFQTRTAFTPANGQKFYTVLVAEQN